jgi:hypothetical protein
MLASGSCSFFCLSAAPLANTGIGADQQGGAGEPGSTTEPRLREGGPDERIGQRFPVGSAPESRLSRKLM